jgi:FtsP/CotA-like multicopper oxidase with cupredoxin domain
MMNRHQPTGSAARSSRHRGWGFNPKMSRRNLLIGGASLATIAALSNCSSSHDSDGTHDVRRSADGLLDTRLDVAYAVNRIGDMDIFTRTIEGTITGPTLRLRANDLLRIRMGNFLPPDVEDHVDDINTPHGFNTVNLHTHGFHVSPLCSEDGSVCGDNILIEIHPGESQIYEYAIPANHPDGTFWYHPHKHGAAAVHFNGGMAGAIIIEGATDEFLKANGIENDDVYMVQQIRVNENGEVPIPASAADLGLPPIFTLNGQFQPVIRIRPSDVYRWRFINGGSIEHCPLELRDSGGARLPLHQLACDGITLPQLEETEQIFLASGNRIDVLAKIDQPGTYQLVKPELDQGLPAGPVPEALIATVIVEGSARNVDLPTGALPTPPALSPITDDELTGTRMIEWGIDFSRMPYPLFMVNGLPFDPDRIDHTVNLNDVEEWTILNPTVADHPFHIHQNHFQVTHVNGVPLAVPKWQDTINVPHGTGFLPAPPIPSPDNIPGSVTIRTRYEDFVGLFVLHCHLLDHEDLGMMQTVQVI